jgi:uncharacterized membrane protein YjgN (DUF898 family)
MSSHITLNKWFGADRSLTARKLAKMFRMNPEEGTGIMVQLAEGDPWKFQYKISDDQLGDATAYLRSMGFQVDSEPVVQELASPESADGDDKETSTSGTLNLGFNGKGGSLFGIMLGNLLLRVITLGIYHFWAVSKVRRYMWSNTSFANDRLAYHGTGGELLKGFMRFMGIVILIAGSLVLVQMYGGPYLNLPEIEPLIMQNALTYTLSFLFTLALPALMVGAMRYRWSRTSWRGIRFSFRGTRGQAMKIYYKGFFLAVLTLGLYWPFFKMETTRFWRENSYFGDRQVKFTGKGKDIFWRYILAIPLSVLTLGIYLVWYQAYLKRYMWSHTQLARGTFKFSASGLDLFGLQIVNLLTLVITLGLAYPWVMVRNQNFLTKHLSLEGNVQLDRVVQQAKQSGTFGEAALDVYDLPMDIG